MGWFSGKRIGDPGAYTFQQVLTRLAAALDQANKNDASDLELEITVRSANVTETIKIPKESLQEVVEILKLNAEASAESEQ